MQTGDPTLNAAEGIVTAPATSERWPDVLEVFRGSGDRDCWCQYWRESSSNYSKRPPGTGRTSLRDQVSTGPPPGILAYSAGQAVGWLGLWPRERLERLVRSRTIPKVDERPVWSIVCFKVRVGYRRKGVAQALLNGAVDFARQAGVSTLEAYPIDPEGRRIDVTFGYVGFTPMFERTGFERIIETDARSAGRRRILMRRELTGFS